MGKKKIATIFGTRPEITKMAALMPALDEKYQNIFIYTGQHYSPELSYDFFEDLHMREPDINLDLRTPDVGTMKKGIRAALEQERPNFVIVYGDTNSSIAAAEATKAVDGGKVPLVHLEAGLRAWDDRMSEETGRIRIDRLSDLLLTPSNMTKEILKQAPSFYTDSIEFVGNTITDTLDMYAMRIPEVRERDYFLLTLHRVENIGSKTRFQKTLDYLATLEPRRIVYSVHPHAARNIIDFGISIPHNIEMRPAMDYFTFLGYLKKTDLVFTDSGGVQEEAAYFNIPCITLRHSTERTETLSTFQNKLFSIQWDEKINGKLIEAVREVRQNVSKNGIIYPYKKNGSPVRDEVMLALENYYD